MSKKKWLIGAAVVGAVIITAVALTGKNKDDAGIPVEVAKVARQKVVQTVTANGKIQPKTQINISADVSAKIVRLAVKEGDWVEKGQLLLKLDNERYMASLESAEANLRSVKSEMRLAQENLSKAEKDLVRTKALYQQNLESQATQEAVNSAYQVALARYQAAKDRVAQAAAAVKQARDDLAKTTIYAPMSGTVSKLNKESGEIALGSQFQEDVIMVISDLAGMEALVDVDENDIVNVSIGDTARVEVDAFPDVVFTGIVTEIANSAKVSGAGSQEQKTEFEVKIAINGTVADGASASLKSGAASEVKSQHHSAVTALRPGMTAGTDIVTNTRNQCIAVPIQAVAVRTPDQLKSSEPKVTGVSNEGNDSPKFHPDKDGFVEIVFVVKGDRVEARQVRTGIQSDSHIEILDGLAEGEEIVIGNYRAISKDLQNGSKIETTEKEKDSETLARG
jgi:HlyD family secretion protein